MKTNSVKKKILALLTAPSLLFSVPHPGTLPRTDGVFLNVLYGEKGVLQLESLLDGTFFFGESTTAHLARVGGVLDTPPLRRHVWRDESGTRMLDRRTPTSRVNYIDPNGTVHHMTFEEAVSAEQPRRLVLSFGLNGILFFQKNPDLFLKDYRRLIDRIRELSPKTEILIQSVYPIRCADTFGCDLETVNGYISKINQCLFLFSKETENVIFLDTASVLRTESGALQEKFDAGDGIHLTNEAYVSLLSFLATNQK